MKAKIQSFFSTPQKTAISCVVLAVIVVAIIFGCRAAANTMARSNSIGEDNAINYACADAGVDPASIENVTSEFSHESGQFVYEVEFTADGFEYDYYIKASDGSVVLKEIDTVDETAAADSNSTTDTDAAGTTDDNTVAASEDASSNTENTEKAGTSDSTGTVSAYSADNTGSESDTSGSSSDSGTSDNASDSTGSADSNSGITLKKAKNIALDHAGVSASVATFTKAKTDYEDGTQVYEIEFYTASYEYKYEINASTGDIVSHDKEKIKSSSSSNSGSSGSSSSGNSSSAGSTSNDSSGNYISTDKAKSIAVSDAGYSVSNVTFKKVKFEKDDGVYVYEVEFYYSDMEYEYSIRATDGTILEKESERDDD